MGLSDARVRAPDRSRDEGAVLLLTLMLTVVLAVIVLGVATYAAVGLRTSRITTERTEGNADASAALSWAVEELAAKRLTADDCDGGALALPAGILASGRTATVSCTAAGTVNDSPTVVVTSATSGAASARIAAHIQLPVDRYGAPVLAWNADGDAVVPTPGTTPIVTTTTTAPAATTTTAPDATTTTTTTTPTTTTPTTTTTTTTTTVPSTSVSCSFTVVSAWPDGGNGELTITNHTAETLHGWEVEIAHEGAAISLWNASHQDDTATRHLASDKGWNKELPANATVTPTGGGIEAAGLAVGHDFACEVVSAG